MKTIKLYWKLLIAYIKLHWRKFTGKCILCGTKREKHPLCLHCQYSKYLCHRCGKYWSFGANYGMGRKKLLEILNA